MKRIVLGLTFVLAMAAAFSQNDLQPLAVVKLNKSETITVKQLKNRAGFIQKQYRMDSLPVEQKQALLENLISEKLITQAAAKEGMGVSDSQVDEAFLRPFSQQLGMQLTKSQLEEIIKKQTGKDLESYILESVGMSLTEYKAYLKNQLIVQQYVFAKKQSEIQAQVATDDEIRKFYEMNKSNFVWNDMMSVFLVMVPKGTNDMASRALTTELRNKYAKDASSAKEIRESEENGKSYRAGDITIAKTAEHAQQLGWSIDKMNELFSKKAGYISDVTETSGDYQFYAVLKKYDAKMLAIGDSIQPEGSITVYDYIKGNITNQKQSQFFSQKATELAKELDTKANVDRKKEGDALKKLLNW